MSKEVLAVKLVSNEEVLGIIVEETDEYYVLSSARSLVMNQSQTGEVSLGMLPFMVAANNPEHGSESDVMLYKKDIMGKAISTPEPLAKSYLQSVSGIVIV